ncbi:hypothetical protein CALVIDRAFT_393530 [Calocera viscosa TUFC12733]|uniref:Uncharacterized protein n=1 Tax=Calocera viscosa (strain TUFC12733) TaxID=1330018 RepID=A0A167GCX1_CALVF|nr:hypothetical protein CALVIDRAFT_393530 [Calocera viscosa TUFC12733]
MHNRPLSILNEPKIALPGLHRHPPPNSSCAIFTPSAGCALTCARCEAASFCTFCICAESSVLLHVPGIGGLTARPATGGKLTIISESGLHSIISSQSKCKKRRPLTLNLQLGKTPIFVQPRDTRDLSTGNTLRPLAVVGITPPEYLHSGNPTLRDQTTPLKPPPSQTLITIIPFSPSAPLQPNPTPTPTLLLPIKRPRQRQRPRGGWVRREAAAHCWGGLLRREAIGHVVC